MPKARQLLLHSLRTESTSRCRKTRQVASSSEYHHLLQEADRFDCRGGKDFVTAVEVAAAQTDCSGHLYRGFSRFSDESIRETKSVDIESRGIHRFQGVERYVDIVVAVSIMNEAHILLSTSPFASGVEHASVALIEH